MTNSRYSNVAIVLHWLMAVLILAMLIGGFFMGDESIPRDVKFELYQLHKSVGVTLLVLLAARIAWRLFNKPPALPASFSGLERFGAHAGHIALYACMLAMPLSGWLMVSSSVYGLPTMVFGLFEWPHIPDLQGNEGANNLAKFLHYYVAIAFLLFIAGHILAVIKHAVWDKESVLNRMWFRK